MTFTELVRCVFLRTGCPKRWDRDADETLREWRTERHAADRSTATIQAETRGIAETLNQARRTARQPIPRNREDV